MGKNLFADPKLHQAIEFFRAACEASRERDAIEREALATYGDHGAPVSGIGRDHFPEVVKVRLRGLARAVTRHSAAGYAARPKGRRVETMRELARAVATVFGDGFYGPRAYHDPMTVTRYRRAWEKVHG